MNIFESIKIAIDSIISNKIRSFLTMLGIIIGVSSVMAIVAIGQGGQTTLKKEMEMFGANRFGIYYDKKLESDADYFTIKDINRIKSISTFVEKLAPLSYDLCNIKNKGENIEIHIMATSADYDDIANLNTAYGRFLNEDDEKGKRKVAVIDSKLANKLFGSTKAIGKRIRLYNHSFRIIGVLKEEDSMLGGRPQNGAYVPISSYQSLQEKAITSLEGKAITEDKVDRAISQVLDILERRHRKKDLYGSYNAEKEMDAVNKVTGTVSLVISVIAGISLLVGGIGIMNIMLVSVTERTREIGVRKALGARESDIMMQFLIESLVLSSIGGIIGLLLGFGISLIIAKFIKIPPQISWQMIVLAFGFSGGVGVFFGIYPAKKAAYQDPIEALRYE